VTIIVLGAKRIEHRGMIGMDQFIRKIFGGKKGEASASSFTRFFSKFDMERNDKVFLSLMKYIFSQVPMRFITVDIFSSVITRYDHQEHAVKEYNPAKRGRKSHHPIMAFSEEHKMVINVWMITGDSHSTTDAQAFMKRPRKL
jgi:hypothetical protein